MSYLREFNQLEDVSKSIILGDDKAFKDLGIGILALLIEEDIKYLRDNKPEFCHWRMGLESKLREIEADPQKFGVYE